jgi:hypothetical protein
MGVERADLERMRRVLPALQTPAVSELTDKA